MSSSNHIKNVAIVGAGGNSGSHMTKSLLETGKHTVTALTREGSKSKLPDGVVSKQVDYESVSSLADAMKGQDALVITLSAMAPKETQPKLIKAAAQAGVPWILPNGWSPDTAVDGPSANLIKGVEAFQEKEHIRQMIKNDTDGKCSFIDVHTGFWYEWSLSLPFCYGFDIKKKVANFFDNGETKITTSTWPQTGRTVAAILSLPIKAEGGDSERCLENLRNKLVYVKSFTINQQEMLDSILRVTGDKVEDWTINKEPVEEVYANGKAEMMKGNRSGFARMMYSRVFFPDTPANSGNHEKTRGLQNELLGLPQESLDGATKDAMYYVEHPLWG